MIVDRFTKLLLTLITIFLGVIALSLISPVAYATRVDSQSGMDMVRVCERSYNTINCADITADYSIKVELNDNSIRKLANLLAK
jgi:hypothetical protein